MKFKLIFWKCFGIVSTGLLTAAALDPGFLNAAQSAPVGFPGLHFLVFPFLHRTIWMMKTQLRPALILFALLTLLTGVLYPLVVTGIAQALFPRQADGSLIVTNGKTYGSALIGQQFDDPKYFWGRPSAAGYDAAASSGSNLGPTNPALLARVRARIEALRAADPGNTLLIPVDLVTASASGLDPNISIAAALYQIHRVAQARGLSDEMVKVLVDKYTQGRQFGFLGEPRVNVLLLNLALDGIPTP